MGKQKLRKGAALLGALLLTGSLLAGCGSDQDELYSQALGRDDLSTEEVAPSGDGLEGSLTISTEHLYEGTGVQAMAELFMEQNPGVSITLNEGLTDQEMTDTSGSALENYASELATSIMSGEGPDIVADLGLMSPRKYGESGLFLDLHELMEADPEFHREDYFTNILDAFAYEGKLFNLPATFAFNMVIMNETIAQALNVDTDALSGVDYQDAAEWFSQAREQGLLPEDATVFYEDASGARCFEDYEISAHYGNSLDTMTLGSSDFVQYLETTKEVFPPAPSSGLLYMTSGGTAQDFLKEQNALFFRVNTSIAGVKELLEKQEGCSKPLVMQASTGDTVFGVGSNVYSITSSCKDPELAWEFLMFCVEEVERPGYYDVFQEEGAIDIVRGAIPINQANFRKYAEVYARVEAAQNAWYADAENVGQFDVTQLNLDEVDQQLREGDFQVVETYIREMDIPTDREVGLALVTEELLSQYYTTDTMSAQECAQKLQERAEIYYRE